jgi:hypothetical protein
MRLQLNIPRPDKEETDMRRLAFRTLIASAALVAMTAPFAGGASGPASWIFSSASACSNPGCTVITSTTGVIDTYVSPITITAASNTFDERATTGQVSSITLGGTVGFTVLDPRGNNEGWVASLTSTGFASSLFPLLPIPAGDITVAGTPLVNMVCYGPYGCGTGVGIGSSVGSALDPFVGVPVAAECPAEAIGEGQYAVVVPLSVTVTGLPAEKLGSYPASWFGNFGITVQEGLPETGPTSPYPGYGC